MTESPLVNKQQGQFEADKGGRVEGSGRNGIQGLRSRVGYELQLTSI